jgi:hypothetical protein
MVLRANDSRNGENVQNEVNRFHTVISSNITKHVSHVEKGTPG